MYNLHSKFLSHTSLTSLYPEIKCIYVRCGAVRSYIGLQLHTHNDLIKHLYEWSNQRFAFMIFSVVILYANFHECGSTLLSFCRPQLAVNHKPTEFRFWHHIWRYRKARTPQTDRTVYIPNKRISCQNICTTQLKVHNFKITKHFIYFLFL